MWLDELQRYLDGEHGLTGAVVRALLGAPHPVVIIGTLWPDRYTAYTAVPAPGGPDPHAREREVLDLAAVIRIGAEFSPAEQDRARAAAARDRRLAVALGAAGYGLTQTLAAAPQLVARWEDAQAGGPVRVGGADRGAGCGPARRPRPAQPPICCGPPRRATAPARSRPRRRATGSSRPWPTPPKSCTAPPPRSAPPGPAWARSPGTPWRITCSSTPAGNAATARVPASTWDALLSHVRDPADAARLADSARNRLLYRYAIPLYRHAADAGDGDAARQLADLLAERGRPGRAARPRPTPATRTPPGSWPSCWPSAATWTGCAPGPTPATWTPPCGWPGCWPSAATWTELRARADAGDADAAWRLAELLARARRPGRGCAPGPTPATGTPPGGWPSCWPSAATWTGRCAPGPTPATGTPPGSWPGCWPARRPGRGRADPARPGRRRRPVRRHASWPGCWPSAATWTGCAPGPTPATGTPPGSWPSCWPSAATWTSCAPGPTPATGTPPGGWPICWPSAATWTGPRAPGPTPATGTPPGGWPICWPSAGTWTELRARADAGDEDAARQLATLLAERGDLDGLRARADAGDGHAAGRLAELLAERGDLDELRVLADAGDWAAAGRLADLLAERGDPDGAAQVLLVAADTGNGDADQLAELLAQRGQGQEAERLRRFGLNPDGSIAPG